MEVIFTLTINNNSILDSKGGSIMNYGERISELRERRGWTQEELANSVGITRAALSHYEKTGASRILIP